MLVLSSTWAYTSTCVDWASGEDEYAAVVPIYARISFLKYLQVSFLWVYAVSF